MSRLCAGPTTALSSSSSSTPRWATASTNSTPTTASTACSILPTSAHVRYDRSGSTYLMCVCVHSQVPSNARIYRRIAAGARCAGRRPRQGARSAGLPGLRALPKVSVSVGVPVLCFCWNELCLCLCACPLCVCVPLPCVCMCRCARQKSRGALEGECTFFKRVR